MNPDLLALRLAGCRLLEGLIPTELRMLVDVGALRDLAKGDRLDEGPHELRLLLAGAVELTCGRTEDGQPFTVTVGAGAALNELAFLGCRELFTSARCVKAGQIFAIPREAFDRLVSVGSSAAAKIAAALARSVAARVHDRNDALMELMRKHEAVLESLERVLTDPQVQTELFGAKPAAKREFAAFREDLLAKWNY